MKRFKIGLMGLLCIVLPGLILTASPLNAQPNRGAGVPRDMLPEDLKALNIRDDFIPSSQKEAGVIHALTGQVVVIHGAGNEAYFGKVGDTIYENDALQTLSDSRCRVMFRSDDLITMAQDTRFSVDGFDDRRDEGRKTSFFSMLKGKAMFYALRLFRYKETRFRVKTPTAVVGVRGTKFGAHVYWLEENKRGDAGNGPGNGTGIGNGVRVADSGKAIGPYLAQAGPGGGGQAVTIVAAGDGQVDVNDVTLNPGDVFNTLTRERFFDPEQRILNQIESSAQVTRGTGEGGTETGGEPSEDVVTDTGEEASPATFADLSADLTENTQVQNSTDTENMNEPGFKKQEKPTRYKGYFTGMLINESSVFVEDVFVSESLQDFAADTVRAEGLLFDSSDDHIEWRGASPVYLDPYLKRVLFSQTTKDSGDLGTTHQIEEIEIGHNSYQVWGYWTETQIFIDGDNYYFPYKSYFIYGEETLNMPPSGNYTYRGDAWGTYFGGQDMTGTFTAAVNFQTGTVTDFDMSVSGGDKGAEIKNASGSISGAEFALDKNSGEWILTNGGDTYNSHTDPNEVKYRGAYGAFYGPNAEYTGGAWSMKEDSTNAATGIFQGKR